MNYRYIILGNGTDWCEISLNKISCYENAKLINTEFPTKIDGVLSKLMHIHFSYKANKLFELPFKQLWFNGFMNCFNFERDKTNVLVVYDRNSLSNDKSFLHYIRKQKEYKIILVYVFTNIIRFSGAKEHEFVQELSNYFDIVFAFDPEDAKKYGFSYSPLIYDALNSTNKEERKAFYIGKAKDRYGMLIGIFEKLKSFDYKRDFNIVGIEPDNQKYSDEIIFNKYMPYMTAIEHIQSSDTLIEVIQGNSAGLTIKTCEAVCYDKKLVTTNKHVKEYPFYDEKFIQVISCPEDISYEFLTSNNFVRYSEEGKKYFSLDSFFSRIEIEVERMQLNGKRQ